MCSGEGVHRAITRERERIQPAGPHHWVSMREDLPCDEPLPKLWSMSLAPGIESPLLEDFELLETIEGGWRVRGVRDGSTRALCETRFVLPERVAAPQLGRLRELMMREARLLGALSHDCVVPLEIGWLEQRTGVDDPRIRRGNSSRNTTRRRGEYADEASASAEQSRGDKDVLSCGSDCQCKCRGAFPVGVREGGCLRRPHAPVPGAAAFTASVSGCCGYHPDLTSAVLSPHRTCGDVSRGEDDVVATLLRSWVPLTVEDDDEVDPEGGGERGSSIEFSHGVGRNRSRVLYGGLEQLQWGGDEATDWRGTAEPKSTARRLPCATNTSAARKPLDIETPGPSPAIGAPDEYHCLCAKGDRPGASGSETNYVLPRHGERTLSLASYLLLPDWLPLSTWFVQEFEPKTATSGSVTAADDWALVWRHLLSMFIQVVRGVEHVHTQGLIHNNISPSSVWVATDGRCCVGKLNLAAPPGFRRPPLQSSPGAAQHDHFASPERRKGRRVGTKSDSYSLGVLMLEFWRNYVLSRDLEVLCLAGDDGLVERMKSNVAGIAQSEDVTVLLDGALVRSMLAKEPFDRPDCFEVVDTLDASLA